MEKLGIRQPEYKALLGLLKLARKDKLRETLHHLLIQDGAIHATNGKMLIRLNKGAGLEPEPLKLSAGVYEVLKADISGKHSPTLLSVEKIEGTPPAMGEIIGADINEDFKPFDLYLEDTSQGLTTAVVKLFKAFGHAFNFEFLKILTPIDRGFKASLLNGANPSLKLENENVTALIMPFTID